MFKRWLEKLAGSNTLYYPGCVTHYALSDVERRYEDLLRRAGVDFIVLPGETLCCGAGGGVKSNFPDLADAIACERLSQVENGRLCTACPLCYAHFKENAEAVEVLEFSEALTHSLETEGTS